MNADGWQPADQRIRRRIIEAVDENMCVEAGAGTGKTTVLVERIVEVVRQGHTPIHHIVVITFTEKAAAELSARVRRALESARTASTTSNETQRLDDALRGLNAAHIETIHAFAASLLRERPVEGRLDPGFEVLDELPGQFAFEAAYGDWITEQMAQDPPPAALVDALDLGLDFRLVREAAERLNRHRDAMPLAPYVTEPFDLDTLIAELRVGLAVFADWESKIVDDTNVTFKEFQRVRELQGQLIALSGRPESALRLIADTKLPDVRSGRQEQWLPHSAAPKKALEGVKRALARTQATIKQGAIARLTEWVQGFVHYYDARRKAEGKADFDDLLIWARNLVRDDAAVRSYFQDKYRCILVDEFQDTDPRQAEMIIRLCAAEDPGVDWRGASLRPGSLFAVGDPKQSIYRFRGADITMYDDVKRDVFRGQTLEITQNFRSCAAIIDWVNLTFGQLITEEKGVQPHYIALDPHPDYAHGGVSVVRGAVTTAQGSPNATETRRAEAKALAALIAREIAAGAWIVRDGESSETRPASYRDVAILVPTRTELFLYEDELMLANVPYRHEGGRSFFKRQEVRELIAILRAIDDPSDQVAVIAALRSPGFACSDEDLFLHREHWRFDYQSLPAGATGLVADSLRALRELAGRRFELTLPELVRELIDTLRLVEFAMLQHQGEQVAANLLKVIDQARAFSEARRSAGLRGFVRWLKENVTREADETDASVSEETDDVVRLVTVHAAKGLEFGVVVFANMNTIQADRTNIITSREQGSSALQMKLGPAKDGFRTPGYDEAELLEKSHARAEQLRLLYVAATRARDHLVVPFVRVEKQKTSSTDAKSLNDCLLQARADDVHDVIEAASLREHDGDVPALRANLEGGTESDTRSIIEKREAWQASRRTLFDDQLVGLRVHTASSLKAGWEPAVSGAHEIRRGRATDFGTAVHQLLERIDLSRTEDIPAAAQAIGSEYGFTNRISEIEACARNVLAHDVIRRALASPRFLREVAFTAPLPDADDGGLAEGRIDLLFVEDGVITIVDFKTDDIALEEVAERSATYQNQALIYAWAAHRTTNLPVREVIFLYARIAHADHLPVDAAFLAEAEALLRTPATAM